MSLNIDSNYITKMDFQKCPLLKQLSSFSIGNNVLMDLDDEKMLIKFSNLKNIYMNGNPFDCERLHKILGNLKRKKVNALKMLHGLKTLDFTAEFIDGFECLSTYERIKRTGSLFDPFELMRQLEEILSDTHPKSKGLSVYYLTNFTI